MAPPPSEIITRSQGFDINERGQVALTVTSPSRPDQSHAGIWQIGGRRGVVDLGTLPGYTAFPSDMNDRGDIVGYGRDEDGVERALLWRRGEVIELGTLGGPSSHAEVVNDRGVVLGQSGRADGEWHAFLWRRGRMIDLGDLGGENVAPADLNDHGQVVGFSETDDPRHVHAFLWQDGQMIDLGALVDPDASSYAYDINDRGQIVGEVGGRPVIWTVHSS